MSYQALLHIIREITDWVTPYSLASFDWVYLNGVYFARISETSSDVSLFPTPPRPLLSPVLYACKKFSERVTHSRLSTLLSFLSPLIWFTSGLFSGFGMKAKATKRCMLSDLRFDLSRRLTIKYPVDARVGSLNDSSNDFILPIESVTERFSDLTLPKFDTSYLPSNPTTGLNISFINTNIQKTF